MKTNKNDRFTRLSIAFDLCRETLIHEGVDPARLDEAAFDLLRDVLSADSQAKTKEKTKDNGKD